MGRERRQTRRRSRRARAQKGGALAKLPIADMEEFKREWAMYYLGSHGWMTDNVMTVPANTYILFMVPSGEVCDPTGKDMRLFNSLLLGKRFDTKEKFLEGWLPVLKGETESSGHGFSLYKEGEGGGAAAAPATVGFYEPGDKVHDVQLEFVNNDPYVRFIDFGLYEAPLTSGYLSVCEQIWEWIDKKYPTGKIPLTKMDQLRKLYEKGNTRYIERADNLIKAPVMAVNLSTLLASPDRLGIKFEAGKKRLIIVNACRVPIDKDREAEMKTKARRLSLSQRRSAPAAAASGAAEAGAAAAAASGPASSGASKAKNSGATKKSGLAGAFKKKGGLF